MHVILGNSAVIDPRPNPDEENPKIHFDSPDPDEIRYHRADLGEQLTHIFIPDATPPSESLATIKALWGKHSAARPSSIFSEDDFLTQLLLSEVQAGGFGD